LAEVPSSKNQSFVQVMRLLKQFNATLATPPLQTKEQTNTSQDRTNSCINMQASQERKYQKKNQARQDHKVA
jgi:hypothetical protein